MVKIQREKTGLFSDLANKLVYNQADLVDFLGEEFSLKAFEKQILQKKSSYSNQTREVLTEALNTKYAHYTISSKQAKNLNALADENTFTITTGHQLSLLTGPLYFVIKILHAVRLAEEVAKKHPNYTFVPIFWMASEDHDFEEINQVNLFHQTLAWNTDQTGAVGRFTLENWAGFIEQVKGLFANHPQSEILSIINSYNGKNLGEATFKVVNSIFAHEGILVLDGDDTKLKTIFSPIIEKELTNRLSVTEVEKTNKKLIEKGIPTQAHGREINLFLLENGSRQRIQFESGSYFTESGLTFSQQEILTLLKTNPENFSPNVILRPCYQEMILPNLCYLGGGGEMAYWLQLKNVFDLYGLVFPLIQVRNSMMILDKATQQKIENVGWSTEQLFEEVETLKKSYVLQNAEELNFKEMRQKQMELIAICRNLVNVVDPGMVGYLEAEMTRLTNQMDNLEQKLIRATKIKYEKVLKQMDQVHDKLFPNKGLQERTTNFFNFCADGNVRSHLTKIKETIDPFEKDFIVLYL